MNNRAGHAIQGSDRRNMLIWKKSPALQVSKGAYVLDSSRESETLTLDNTVLGQKKEAATEA